VHQFRRQLSVEPQHARSLVELVLVARAGSDLDGHFDDVVTAHRSFTP